MQQPTNLPIADAIDGDAVLFLGAGFSRGAINLENAPMKTAAEFASHLAGKVELPPDTPLDQSAEVYLMDLGHDALAEEVRNQFTAKEVTDTHKVIASLPWKRVYTTNYDDVYEDAMKRSGLAPRPVVLSDDLQSIDLNSHGICIHINGAVSRLTKRSFENEMKLTASSYAASEFSTSPWSRLFATDLQSATAVFFVGYSLADLDIRRLLYASQQLQKKTWFITAPAPAKQHVALLSPFGTIAPIGADAFASLIPITQRTHNTRVRRPFHFSAFRASSRPGHPLPATTDREAFGLLLFGQYSVEQVASAVKFQPDHSYIIARDALVTLWDAIESEARAVVVHSRIGNGKTLLVDALAAAAQDHGVQLFYLHKETQDAIAELDRICSLQERVALVIENYYDHYPLLERLSHVGRDNLTLILTARSSQHDVNVDKLTRTLRKWDIHEHDVNRLTDGDIQKLSAVLDHYGLWGTRSAESPDQKFQFIRKNCSAQLQSVLLAVLRSPMIKERLEAAIGHLLDDQSLRDVVILIMLTQVFNVPADADLVMAILSTDILNSVRVRRQNELQELLSIESGEIRARSSTLATYVLSEMVDGEHVISCLERIVRYCHDRKYDLEYVGDASLGALYRECMRFANLQEILGEGGKLPLIERFYSSIKGLRHIQGHPHFWLQYAVAMLSMRQFAPAKQYFDTAYSFARKMRGYDTSFIDNHFARFLLETTIAKGTPQSAMEYFRDARDIVLRQAGRDAERHYPFRVATKFADFYERFKVELSAVDRKEILDACRKVLESSQRLGSRARAERSVRYCESRLGDLIAAEGGSRQKN